MKIEKIELAKLTQHPKNPRRGDVKIIEKSLRQNGQFRPLIVSRETMHILGGNHTAKALENIGTAKADVVFLDNLTPEQELKILLADNRTSDNSKYDDAQLLEILNEFAEIEDTIFTQEEKDALALKAYEFANKVKIKDQSGEIAKATATAPPQELSFDKFASHLALLALVGAATIKGGDITIELSPEQFIEVKEKLK